MKWEQQRTPDRGVFCCLKTVWFNPHRGCRIKVPEVGRYVGNRCSQKHGIAKPEKTTRETLYFLVHVISPSRVLAALRSHEQRRDCAERLRDRVLSSCYPGDWLHETPR